MYWWAAAFTDQPRKKWIWCQALEVIVSHCNENWSLPGHKLAKTSWTSPKDMDTAGRRVNSGQLDKCGRTHRNVDIAESHRNGPQLSMRHDDDDDGWLYYVLLNTVVHSKHIRSDGNYMNYYYWQWSKTRILCLPIKKTCDTMCVNLQWMPTIRYFPIAHQLITGSLVEFISCICILSRLQFRLVYICPLVKILPLQFIIFINVTPFTHSRLTRKYCWTYTHSYSLNLT